jgi:hypothetical protein
MGNSDFSGTKTRLLPMTALAPMGNNSIRDIAPSSYWFSALQPIKPSVPAGFRPRQYAYTPGANIIWNPKGEDPIGFDILRELADSWDLLRLVISTQLDNITNCEWDIRVKQEASESNADRKQRNAKDPNIKVLKAFWAKPDGFHPFRRWMRMWMEDCIVLDAVALYIARDSDGKAATIHPLDGGTINRLLTDQGLTPPPPSPAYQAVNYGIPVWDFTTDDLVYAMRNERTCRRYGLSPVEQLIRTICFGLRRQEWQISEYTSGNVPEALVFLPSDLPIARVKEAQDWFDSILSSNLGERRRVRFLPGYGTGDSAKPNVIFPKEPLLKDELDVWLAQLACYCVGVSAQPFMKMMNRASAEEANDAAEEEGLKPYIVFATDILNDLLQSGMGYPDYEFVRVPHRIQDPLKQAQADNIVVGKIRTINEVREDRGDDPKPEPEADQLGVFTPQGFMPLGQTLSPQGTGLTNGAGSTGGNGAPQNKTPQNTPSGAKATPQGANGAQASGARGGKSGTKKVAGGGSSDAAPFPLNGSRPKTQMPY